MNRMSLFDRQKIQKQSITASGMLPDLQSYNVNKLSLFKKAPHSQETTFTVGEQNEKANIFGIMINRKD